MVAGCVGEFWTRLGLLAQGPGFSTQPEGQLLRWGRHYGMGLQLVNILRDREEDLARGRSYLPAPDDRPWLDRAERWLKEGVFYAESLRNGRLRFPPSCRLAGAGYAGTAPAGGSAASVFREGEDCARRRLFTDVESLSFFLERGSVAYAALFAADEAGAVCGEAGAGAGLFPGASSFFRLSADVSAVPPLSGFGAGGGLGASRSSHWWSLNPFPMPPISLRSSRHLSVSFHSRVGRPQALRNREKSGNLPSGRRRGGCKGPPWG